MRVGQTPRSESCSSRTASTSSKPWCARGRGSRVARRTKDTRFLTRAGPAAEEIRVPVATVYGHQDGPTMVMVAGVHGSEYVGIEACKRLFARVRAEELSGTLITVPCLNLP